MVNPNDVPPIPEDHPHVYPINPAPVWQVPMMQSDIDLRDYFAGMAMQGLMSNPEYWNHVGGTDSADTAKIAYLHADAMLAARDAK